MSATRKRRVKVYVSLHCRILVINKLTLGEMRKHLQSGKFKIVIVNLWVVVINVSTAITNTGKLPEGASTKSTVFRVGVI